MPLEHARHRPDPFVDYHGSEIMHAQLQKAGADTFLWDTFEDPAHDIVQTKDAEKVLEYIIQWVEKRAAGVAKSK